jgi:hypothetical protein
MDEQITPQFNTVTAEPQVPPLQDDAYLDKWSWGAFMLNVAWGIGNRVWISLIAFIPFLGFIMAIILGIKGRRWAWETGRWASMDQFKASQETWDHAGKILFFIALGFFVLYMLFFATLLRFLFSFA